MSNTFAALTAAVTLALTVPGQAATPQSNLQAIERLAERRESHEKSWNRAGIRARHISRSSGSGADSVADDQVVAGDILPAVPVLLNQQRPGITLQMTPAEIRYETERPWMLIQRPHPGAVRVRGGWLVHWSSDYTGFYRSVTEAEARQLRRGR